jgi:hypothetical protein
MFDTCFDSPRSDIPRTDRRVLWGLRIVAAALTMMAGWAGAQIPNAPVLQNVWAMPGMVGAFNLGGGGGGSVYAAAGSWTPSSGRFQLSGGIGSQSRTGSGGASWAYGVRGAIPLASPDATFGFGAFAGIGGGSAAKRATADSASADTTTTSTTQIPVGVAVGWRHAIASRGFSLYATPSYVWQTGGGGASGRIRAAVGADVGLTNSIGVTGGIEFGQAGARSGGQGGTVYGLGVSYAFGRR